MGNGISGSALYEMSGEGPSTKPRLDDIPESCLALVLTHLDPPEICKLARLNRAFRNASSADFLWELKLPSNYRFLLEKLVDDKNMAGLCKKDLYARLCKPNPFDGGRKEVWLDKNTGGVCLSISSKALNITGIDDRRQWNHIPTNESSHTLVVKPLLQWFLGRYKIYELKEPSAQHWLWFQTVAYLQQAWWVEVNGVFEFQFSAGTYSLYFRLHLGRSLKKLGRRVCNYEHIHGWDVKPVRFELATPDGQHSVSQCLLDNPGNWVKYYVGDFVVERPNEVTKIKFSLTQIDCTHAKGGLCVDAVFIYPSAVECETFKTYKGVTYD